MTALIYAVPGRYIGTIEAVFNPPSFGKTSSVGATSRDWMGDWDKWTMLYFDSKVIAFLFNFNQELGSTFVSSRVSIIVSYLISSPHFDLLSIQNVHFAVIL